MRTPDIGASLLWLIPLQAIVVLTALSIAFAIAGLTPNPETANLVGGSVALPLFVLTGAFVPVAAMPAPLPDIVPYAVPFSARIEAIRGIALSRASVTAYGPQLAVRIAWLVAIFAVAARAYRFIDERCSCEAKPRATTRSFGPWSRPSPRPHRPGGACDAWLPALSLVGLGADGEVVGCPKRYLAIRTAGVDDRHDPRDAQQPKLFVDTHLRESRAIVSSRTSIDRGLGGPKFDLML